MRRFVRLATSEASPANASSVTSTRDGRFSTHAASSRTVSLGPRGAMGRAVQAPPTTRANAAGDVVKRAGTPWPAGAPARSRKAAAAAAPARRSPVDHVASGPTTAGASRSRRPSIPVHDVATPINIVHLYD